MTAVHRRLFTWSSGAPAAISTLHDFVVTEVRRGDERGAVVRAGHVLRARAAVERDLQHRHVVGDGGDRHDVVALRVERVRVGPAPHQHTPRLVLLAVGGHVERRAAVAVAKLAVGAGARAARSQRRSRHGRGVQAGTRADLGLGGRDLREHLHFRGGDERGTEPEAADAGLTRHPGTSFPASAGRQRRTSTLAQGRPAASIATDGEAAYDVGPGALHHRGPDALHPARPSITGGER